MPALVSHHLFAQSALKQAQPYLANAAAAAPLAFRWGAQGPDILFYHQPFMENNISRTGHRLHAQRVFRMFSEMVSECSRVNTPEATAYLLGYCCHYVLDRMAHPFVTYISNYRIDPLYPQLSHDAQHNLCESELDRALIAAAHSGNPADFRSYMLLSMDSKTANAMGAMLSNAIWAVYGTRVPPNTIKTSMRSMLRIQHLLHDRSGHRHSAISWMERQVHASGFVSSLIRPIDPLDTDCTNMSHQPWIDAATPHMRRYTDYFQILNQAQLPAAQLMDVCYDAVHTGKPLSQHLFPTNYLGLPE
ncbi:MAG: zinc dependent phospholipase C family protein [Clostridia bacterium]|nr:zinc dependent phospholipase C family protein [Clostridia bacterium]